MLLIAPNPMLMRFALDSWDPYFLNTFRFGLGALVLSPIIIRNLRAFSGKGLRPTVIVCIAVAFAATFNVLALKHGPASYVGVVSLISPIVLVVYAAKLTHEKFSSRAIAGITLAAIGAIVIILLPIAIAQKNAFVFYPLATLFAILASFILPLVTVEMKIANQDQHVPVFALIGLAALCGALVSLVLWKIIGSGALPPMHAAQTIAVLYSALVAAILSRALIILSYERVGAAVNSSLTYMAALLAVVLPVIFLHEKLSIEMVVGGALILSGVYLTEHHKSTHHKHHHIVSI